MILASPFTAGCTERFRLSTMSGGAGAWWRFWLCGWRSVCSRKKTRYRAIPGTLGQFNLLVRRAGVKWVRNWGVKFLDVCMFAGAALVIGPPLTASWTRSIPVHVQKMQHEFVHQDTAHTCCSSMTKQPLTATSDDSASANCPVLLSASRFCGLPSCDVLAWCKKGRCMGRAGSWRR